MKQPTLSVICASFNSQKTIKNTLDSVLSQTFKNFEFIVVDNKSMDGTKEILKSYETEFEHNHIDFKWISELDSGLYEAWNKGLRISQGSWISFIGADDSYLPNAIQTYYERIRYFEAGEPDIVHSNVRVVDKKKTIKIINGRWNWATFKRYMNIAHVGSFHNRSYFEQFGEFDESYKICGDYELLLRKRNELKTCHISEILAEMGYHGLSNRSILSTFKETWRAKRLTAGINDLQCFYDFIISLGKYQIRAIIKR